MRMHHIVICGRPALQYFFPHNGTIFKRITENVCFDFLYNFCLKMFHSKKNWARYDEKCILVFM